MVPSSLDEFAVKSTKGNECKNKERRKPAATNSGNRNGVCSSLLSPFVLDEFAANPALVGTKDGWSGPRMREIGVVVVSGQRALTTSPIAY